MAFVAMAGPVQAQGTQPPGAVPPSDSQYVSYCHYEPTVGFAMPARQLRAAGGGPDASTAGVPATLGQDTLPDVRNLCVNGTPAPTPGTPVTTPTDTPQATPTAVAGVPLPVPATDTPTVPTDTPTVVPMDTPTPQPRVPEPWPTGTPEASK